MCMCVCTCKGGRGQRENSLGVLSALLSVLSAVGVAVCGGGLNGEMAEEQAVLVQPPSGDREEDRGQWSTDPAGAHTHTHAHTI